MGEYMFWISFIGLYHLLGNINPDHLHAKGLGIVNRLKPPAAGDIQNLHSGLQVSQLRCVLGQRKPSGVQCFYAPDILRPLKFL